ncbi:serine/threonine-protein kinase VRK3 isoform 1-T1 [Synchiropus picturatus]
MPFHFCPQCGTNLQPNFKFCPSCGEKLPCPEEGTGVVPTSQSANKSSLSSPEVEAGNGKPTSFPSSLAPRPSLRTTRKSLSQVMEVTDGALPVIATCHVSEDEKTDDAIKDTSAGILKSSAKKRRTEKNDPSLVKSPRPVRGKSNQSPAKPLAEGQTEQTLCRSPIKVGEQAAEGQTDHTSPKSRSSTQALTPSKGKGKKTKGGASVEPLCEGTELTDTSGKKWILLQVLSQRATEIYYKASCSDSKEADYVLKLGAKDGRLFNEQNFMQRAAKPSSVEKWMKLNKMDFLGIPSCLGFAVHADSYRFLTFPNMGQSLQSILEGNKCLPETTVLQLACRLIDVLDYIHSNEYVHGDICAEHVFIKSGHESQVYLAGYGHSFRYAPGGQHVECREGSKTPHEGTVEFISLDAHKGAAPSRRSDLQSLGLCLLRWLTGPLPWSDLTQPAQVAAQKQKFMDDIPALMRHCFKKNRVSNPFQKYLSAVVALQYCEAPDYPGLRGGLAEALKKLGGAVEQPLRFS